MPKGDFNTMPSSARVWVFGAAAPITGAASTALLAAVDHHLAHWTAHGAPLMCARDWRDERFLAVAVDESATGASGCSIDTLFRTLDGMTHQLGTSVTDSAIVFFRQPDGVIASSSRAAFRAHAQTGAVTMTTPVFDATVDTVGAWREQFERPAAVSWHAKLLT